MKYLGMIIVFLPWILICFLPIQTHGQLQISIIIALTIAVVTDFNSLRKGFIFSWGTIIFFSLCFIAAIVFNFMWSPAYMNIFVDVWLIMIVTLALMVRKPFIWQYGCATRDKSEWNKPIFVFTCRVSTIVWGLIFGLNLVTDTFHLNFPLFAPWLINLLDISYFVFGGWFTFWFPKWYRNRDPLINSKFLR